MEGFDDALLVRFFNGSATSQEIEKVIQFINEDRENRLNYFYAKRIWLESRGGSNEEMIDDNWKRLNLRMEESENGTAGVELKKTGFPVRRLAMAAGLACLIAITSLLLYQNYRFSQITATENEIAVPYGSRTNITLPDGSDVWLNAGSKLTYSSDFSRNREVSLAGEAFFDVRKLDKREFVVNASELRIRVLGTSFNVKSYPEEDVIETTLVRGKIEVESLEDQAGVRTVMLDPNQKLVYRKSTGRTDIARVQDKQPSGGNTHVQTSAPDNMQVVRNVDTEKYSSWKEGKLIINSEYLGELAIKLERYYNVEIVFRDDSIKKFKYSGTLEEVTIEEVLNALASASPVPIYYKIEKNKVTLGLK